MQVLQIIAHPDTSGNSFTGQLASAWRNGATSVGHTVRFYNLYDDLSDVDHQAEILNAHHICFAFPVWWEMPPAKMVEYLQTVFVKGFAFDLDGDRMRPTLNITVTCLLSMGQQKQFNTSNLGDAMRYCGLHPTFCVFDNVGPRLSPGEATSYLDLARRRGMTIYT